MTFLVVSDLHFGYGYAEADNANLIARMNSIAGRAYPRTIGGTVTAPRGVVITGDLTEWGRKNQWSRFVEMFGLHGTEGALTLPVFEMVGNHDKVDNGPWIADQVALRHGGRFYSWDWDDLHLVALGEAPDEEGIRFLEKDLARVAADVPLVMFFHLALSGPWSTGNWFDDDLKGRLARVLSGRNVVGMFHGHHHATGHYRWRGIDVWKPGAVKNGAHTFAVVRVTDTTWTLASYDWDGNAWASSFVKAIPRAETFSEEGSSRGR